MLRPFMTFSPPAINIIVNKKTKSDSYNDNEDSAIILSLYLNEILMELLPGLSQTISHCLLTSQCSICLPETTFSPLREAAVETTLHDV